MKNEKELMQTHASGFGGSDAATVLAIAEKIRTSRPLTTTQKHRLRVIKGLELPQPSFDSEATKAGHEFEDSVALSLVRFDGHCWERETLLESETKYDNFTVFAHADFYLREQNAVKECKWSRKFDKDGLQREYSVQLQWYYTVCGASSVSLCYDTADGSGVVDIQRNAPLGAAILDALALIDMEWDNLDLNITELYGGDVPERSVALVDLLRNLNSKKEDIERQIEDVRGELMGQMREFGHTKYGGEGWSVSAVDAVIAKTFDAKKFAADHADLYAAYLKDSKKKATLKVTFKQEKGGAQ